MGNHTWAYGFVDREEFRQGNLLTFVVTDINRRQLLGSSAADIIGLDIDTTHFSFLERVIHIRPTKIHTESRHGRSKVDTNRGHLIAVHINFVLRSLRGEEGIHPIQNRIAVARLHNLLGCAKKFIKGVNTTALIEKLKLKSTASSIPRNRWRLHNKNPASINSPIHFLIQALHNCRNRMILSRSFIPVLHTDKEESLIWSIAIKTGATKQCSGRNILFCTHHFSNLTVDRQGFFV